MTEDQNGLAAEHRVSGDLWDDLKPRRSAVEAALKVALHRIDRRTARARIAEAMGYSLLAPGKRLRPLLVMLACEAAGGRRSERCRPRARWRWSTRTR